MTSKMRSWGVAAICACLLVLIAALELNSPAPSVFTRIVLFPIPFVVHLVPAPNLGTATDPIYEGTPLHFLVALASLPLCTAIHTVLLYSLFALGKRLPMVPPDAPRR
jgi:hypothetical protein